MKNLLVLALAIALFCAFEPPARAQDKPAQQPTAEELEKEKAERDKNAYRLLDQVIDESQTLRLAENRVRIQTNAADMLWDNNQSRARSLFSMAAESLAEMARNTPATSGPRSGPAGNHERRVFQLRQELVLAAARHDAPLAYQLLASTKPATPVIPAFDESRFVRPMPQQNTEESLEQTLLGRIAALDPKLAAQNAEQMMEKGQYPRTVSQVIDQLYKQDAEAGAKLADRTVKRVASNILTSSDAASLAQNLLAGGIRVTEPANQSATNGQTSIYLPFGRRTPALEQSAYVDLLSAYVDAALKVSIPAQNQRTAAPRGRTPGAPAAAPRPPGQGAAPTDAQTEQNNARQLFAGIQVLMPMIDQYLAAKASMVRQKLTEAGVKEPSMPQSAAINFDDSMTGDSLIQLATTVPSQMQPRVYQQAAYRFIEEGNTDRARQIATDNLPTGMRDGVMRRVEVRELAKKADSVRFEEIRQNLNRLTSDNQKIDFLIQLAGDAKKVNPKLAGQLLDEARQITNRRATSYEQFDQQLKVARAFASVDPARSFEVLDPGISQLNELLAAAAVLNGFEINMFRDGELSMQAGSGLTSTVNRFGQELAILARNDLERSEILAGRFQLAESRIMARMAIVQGLLRTPQPGEGGPNINAMRPVGQNIARP